MSVNYDLTCWYLNARRIVELTGVVPMQSLTAISDPRSKMIWQKELKDGVIQWLKKNEIKSLEVLLAQERIQPGSVFTHHSNFSFRGISRAAELRRLGKPSRAAVAKSKLDNWQVGANLEVEFFDEHLTSTSALTNLSGLKNMFLLGAVTEVDAGRIKSIPYVFANIIEPNSQLPNFGGIWLSGLQVHIDQIDTFGEVKKVRQRRDKALLEPLRRIPEAQIKGVLAEIINEPTVPKDWGGESSDLFSSHVMLDGQRIATAFLLKGPAKFGPMTAANLGKNGDQIDRLFSEPADLLVLQHCHEVTPPVRGQMRAYSQQMGNPRRFCIIDGYDTLRILQAYNKCGFSPPVGKQGGG